MKKRAIAIIVFLLTLFLKSALYEHVAGIEYNIGVFSIFVLAVGFLTVVQISAIVIIFEKIKRE